MEKILTVNDVAEILQIKPMTVREMFRVKRLRAFKVGKAWRTTEKMLQEDIAALAENRRPAGEAPTASDETETRPVAKRKSKTAKPSKPDGPQKEDSDSRDDSQQLLF